MVAMDIISAVGTTTGIAEPTTDPSTIIPNLATGPSTTHLLLCSCLDSDSADLRRFSLEAASGEQARAVTRLLAGIHRGFGDVTT
jgi:hypothetical protein